MSVQAIVESDCPNLAALISLLSEHPLVAGSQTLTGAVSLLQSQFTDLWEKLDDLPE